MGAPLRVVYEPRLGLSQARRRGISEAEYEVVSFVDDDNWVCSEWVQIVSEIMTSHTEIGACGGDSEAVCETAPPWWFENVKGCYAVGQQGAEMGDITETRGFLWGAGLSVRKSAIQRLVNNGFRSLLSDRRGKLLSSGGDQELCIALRSSGWRLWYDPRLRLQHFIPANRLEWGYLRRLMRGFGASTVGFDAYKHASDEYKPDFRSRIIKTWLWQTADMFNFLVRRHRLLLLSYNKLPEGDLRILDVEKDLGRLYELLKCRKSYRSNILAIRRAPWMRVEEA
jgi:glycosyltransferase involved in cell wall biosynthesis